MQFGLHAEIIGYVGRILSYNNRWDQNGFLIQMGCFTLGPAFFSAAIYLRLGIVVTVYGAENSRIPSNMYTKFFMPCDIVAMSLQAAGGGMASVALTNNHSLSTSNSVMITGLSSQVFTLFIFMVLGIDFGLKVSRRRHELGDDTTLSHEPHLVAIRELNQGFSGPVTFNQYLFVGFEGILMSFTVAALAIFHPALCMGKPWVNAAVKLRKRMMKRGVRKG
ncbi:related to YER185w, Rta1p [Phialocephala subalpina]|uniref:Related to YER185w, Rta1p n=1 Tax=Phialocephala subalpina TaxID=576137 RepID=A0A1L7X6Z5_9HELO|nr:related to YER185w, Rta1p [Phialocephala subalpina]